MGEVVEEIRKELADVNLVEFSRELTANPLFLVLLRREGFKVLLAAVRAPPASPLRLARPGRLYRCGEQSTNPRRRHGREMRRPVEQVEKALLLSLRAIAGVR